MTIMTKLWIPMAIGALTAASAHAYTTEWRPVGSSRVIYSVMRSGWVGSSAQQAAEMAASRCGDEVRRLEREGHFVVALRGTAAPTPSPYVFSGNCDVQVVGR